MLTGRRYASGGSGGFVSYVEQARQLAEAKKGFPWLAEAPSHVLQQTLMDLDRACRRYGPLRVRWRSARRWSPSFRFPDPRQITVRRVGGTVGHGAATEAGVGAVVLVEGEAEGRVEPVDSRQGLVRVRAGAVEQGPVQRQHDREGPRRVPVTTLLGVPPGGPGQPREPSGVRLHHLRTRRARGRRRGQERTGGRAVRVSLWRPRGHPVGEAGTSRQTARDNLPNRRLGVLESPGFSRGEDVNRLWWRRVDHRLRATGDEGDT